MRTLVVAIGLTCIFGGEAFCIFGPIEYQPVIHVVCHIILYSGIVLVAGGAVMHTAHISRMRRRRTGITE